MSELGFYRFAKKDPSEVAIIGPNEEAISRGDLLKKRINYPMLYAN